MRAFAHEHALLVIQRTDAGPRRLLKTTDVKRALKLHRSRRHSKIILWNKDGWTNVTRELTRRFPKRRSPK